MHCDKTVIVTGTDSVRISIEILLIIQMQAQACFIVYST